jgi:hypothetical protein
MTAARERASDSAKVAAALASIPSQYRMNIQVDVRRPVELKPVDRRNVFIALRVTATNLGCSPVDAHLSLRCEAPGRDRPYWDPDSAVSTPFDHCWSSTRSNHLLLGYAEGSVHGRELSRDWRLEPGERVSMDAVLPAYPTTRAELSERSRIPHERRVADARSYWTSETARGAEFFVPDPEVRKAILAARVVLLAARERRDVDWVPLGGPFQYRDVWLRDGARAAEALAVSGYTRESRELARGLLRFRTRTGTFVSQAGQLDGTGQMLWALEQTMLRPSPTKDVREIAGIARRAWEGLEHQRAMTIDNNYGWAPGVLPFTNPKDAERVHAQLVGNDAWSLVGYRATERLLRTAGLRQDADGVARSRRAYLAAFEQALRQTGSPDIPPSWQGIGIDWGNLNVGYPCEVLDANDQRLIALSNRYWARIRGPGLGYYGSPDTLHTYVAADLGTVALLADDRSSADEILDAMIRWRTASGGAPELFERTTMDFGKNFPPHVTAAAALVSLARNALIFDDGDTLALGLGARESWWSGTTVRGAPTRWGTIDLQFRRVGDHASWRWTAVPVWTQLTLPPNTRLRSIVDPLRQGSRSDRVLAPPGTTRADIPLAVAARR